MKRLRLVIRVAELHHTADDARALALSLTQDGVDITQRLIPVAQLYERVSLNGFTVEQADQLRQMLRLLYDNMTPLDHQD